ncbi:type IV secretory system conjugative DNA transfer family protein [Nocardioides ungokensis]|uniref:type IV secretory system conjugative DNA transfer family protein n=1 Tax=Nocardioides ungokensis TaxID=1643322 RepID=UPI0015E030AA|nr:type IV secretory system conjugative DNA transfer family protein [Nocardioides ungokensis]
MSDQRAASNDPLVAGALGVAGLVIGSSALCWIAAVGTLWLTGAATGPAPFHRSPGFALRLIHGDHPSDAWTTTYPRAAGLTGWLFWLLLALLAILLLAGSLIIVRRVYAGHSSRSEPATWATWRQERRLAVPTDPARRSWRLTAGRGRASGRLLAGHDCVSAVAFGPNGSGKTTSLIIPNVIDWDGPVVLTTAKPQDLAPICRARAASGPVWVVAPGGAPGHGTVGWSPISAASDDDQADRIAEWMVDSSGMNGDPKARPWNSQARKYLKGLLLAAHLSGGGLTQWVEWIHGGERARDHVEDILRGAGHDATAREYSSTWSIHEEGKGSVLFTALGLADTYSRPGVADAADRGGFSPAQLLDSRGTLCIVTPNAEGDRFAPYFTTLVSAIVHEAESRAAATSGPLSPRLLLALDEAGNVFRYPRLPHLLTTARGNGIQLLLIYHDLAQVEHLYGGREVARTVVSNAKMRMLLPGVGDLETLRYWSELMGQTRTETHGTTTGTDGRRSRTRNEHTDHLAPLHRLQQLPTDRPC